jgi:hypothetical protein
MIPTASDSYQLCKIDVTVESEGTSLLRPRPFTGTLHVVQIPEDCNIIIFAGYLALPIQR